MLAKLGFSPERAQAIAREVAFVPGAAAFLDGQGHNAMRLNFSGVPEATISEGVRRLEVRSLAGHDIAIERDAGDTTDFFL